MKKWLKVLLKIIAGLLIIIVVIIFFSIESIDKSPYFESDYYKKTIQNMDKAISDKEIAKGNLLAGFAKINITPNPNTDGQNPINGEFNKVKMAGFGDGKIATGVHDSLYAKAIALEVGGEMVVMVSADLPLMPQPVVDGIEKILKGKVNLSRDQIFYGATHTHSSIGNCIEGFIGKSFGGEYQPELVAWLSEQFSQLIVHAIEDKKPAKIGSGYIHVPNLITNRIIGETGRLNDKLNIISVKQDSAKQAVIGIYSAHATIIGSWNDKFSGDYPGYFQRSLESQGIDMAMFYAGTVGSHTNKGEGGKFEKVKYVGKTLADSAKVCINKITYTKQSELSFMAAEIEIPKLQLLRLSDNLRLAPWLAKKLMPEMKSIILQGMKINNFVWVAMPYELSGEYAIDLKNALEIQGYNSAFTSFNGQYLGYIVPAKYYYYDTYEARLMGWYGPSMGDYLMELNYKLTNNLIGSKL